MRLAAFLPFYFGRGMMYRIGAGAGAERAHALYEHGSKNGLIFCLCENKFLD